MLIHGNADPSGKFQSLWLRSHTHGKNNEIKLLFLHLALVIDIRNEQISGFWFFGNAGKLRTDKTDAVIFPGPFVIEIKVLSLRPDVHVEDGRRHIGKMFLSNDRFLDGIHAADGAAVVLVFVAGADALKEGDLLRLLMIRWPGHMTGKRPRSAQHPLKLHARYHIGVTTIDLLRPLRACLALAGRDTRALDH